MPFRSLGFYAVAWIEHFLVHGPGDVQGKRIELDDELAAFTLKAYELDARGNRKVRRAFLSRSKGRNKSGFAAMVECFEALGECRFDHWAQRGEVSDWGYQFEPGEPVGRPLTYVEIINVATEEGQAGNTYDAVYYMLHPETCSPELFDQFGKLDVGLTRINLPNWRGFIEPVSASNESKDGSKSTFIVADETHLWLPPASGVFKLGRMHQTMVRNLLKRKESSGWMLETSTMYAAGEGSVAEGTHSYAKALDGSGRRDSALLFDHRQASDKWDLSVRGERLKALREAYGPAAAWMNLGAIADYWDDPQASEAEFRRFWLNQPVSVAQSEASFDLARWLTAEYAGDSEPREAVFAVHVPDSGAAMLGVAGDVAGKTLVMCYSEPGTAWVAPKVAELSEKCSVSEVVLLPPARALEPAFGREGFECVRLTKVELFAGCKALRLAVAEDENFVHCGQPELDNAVARARLNDKGEPDGWGPVLLAVAAAFYRWQLMNISYDVLESVAP
jgi:hypothetical protein